MCSLWQDAIEMLRSGLSSLGVEIVGGLPSSCLLFHAAFVGGARR
jgi:hypothetical protein